MKRKLEILVLILFCAGISLCLICLWVGILILALVFILCFAVGVFVLLNAALKQTNWYKNVFVYTRQMCSNAGYRDYLIRNLEIVNVGSNPARFAFHYDDVLGENWSTGNQGKEMDFEILKFRHSFIKKGGVVLLPIVPFSSVAGYLKKYRPEYLGIKYYAKFAQTLDYGQAKNILECREAFEWIKYPLYYEKKALKYILHDVQPDTRLSIADMPLMYPQLVEGARHMMEDWLKEFNLKTIHDELTPELRDGYECSVRMMQEIIDFLVERELKPVIILPPMSAPLQAFFTEDVKQRFIYDFIESINRPKVLFLDYSNEKEFQDSQLYFSPLFMNLRGRKLFTRKVLKDLGLIKD
jgi:hypothetical protein